MAQSAHEGEFHHGEMEITGQKQTFGGFLTAAVWGCALLAQFVALLTLAFAIGLGWWAGLGAFVVIGAAVGLVFKLGGAWWAYLIATTVLMGIGGIIIPAIASMAG